MTIEKLTETFFEGVKEIHFKSYGGCLYILYAYFKWMRQNGKSMKGFRVIQYDDSCGQNAAINKRWVRDRKKAVSSQHFIWVYRGKMFDASCDGISQQVEHPIFSEVYPLNDLTPDLIDDFCEAALIQKDKWNNRFDRRKAAKVLKQNLDIDFKHLS